MTEPDNIFRSASSEASALRFIYHHVAFWQKVISPYINLSFPYRDNSIFSISNDTQKEDSLIN